MKKLLSGILILVLASLVFGYGNQIAKAAPGATLNYEPDSSSAKVGAKIHVAAKVTISEFNASAIRVGLKYDPAKLAYDSYSVQNAAFPSVLASNVDQSNGNITLRLGRESTGVSGNVTVADLYFIVKTSGSAKLSFNSSDCKIWQSDTGSEEPLNSGNSTTLTLSGTNTSSGGGSTSTGTGTTGTPKPRSTPTPKSRPTATPTPAPTIDTSSFSAISPDQSVISLSFTNALADGNDSIEVTVTVKRGDGTIVTDSQPSISGLRDGIDTATDFVLDPTGQSWVTKISSNQPGDITLTVTAGGVVLGSKDITFSAAAVNTATPVPLATPVATKTGPSFTTYILIGAGILLVILIALFFVWRKLHADQGEEELGTEAPAFPGDTPPADDSSDQGGPLVLPGGTPAAANPKIIESGEPPTPPGLQPIGSAGDLGGPISNLPGQGPTPEPVSDELTSFNPNAILQQRGPLTDPETQPVSDQALPTDLNAPLAYEDTIPL